MAVLYIIAITIAAFFVDVLTSGLLSANFVLVPNLVLLKPWTLITSMFLHGGLIHLLFNMLGLFMFGPLLESKIGTKNFLILYFACGLLGNLGYIVTSGGGNIGVLGASGAIYGVLGALAILQPSLIVFVGFVPLPIYFAAIFWFIMEFTYGITGSQTGIANFAHLFGLIGGLALGKIYKRDYMNKRSPLYD